MNLENLHDLIHGNVDTPLGIFSHGIWNIFSLINGNPDLYMSGIRLFLSIFFTILLIIILNIRTKMNFDKMHLIAFIGVLFLLARNFILLGFQWGWEIKLYDDYILHFLFPPLDYFFNMMYIGCIAYYSLNTYNYYPGILKRIIWWIPSFITLYFIYMSITWKHFFYSNLPVVVQFNNSSVDCQSHCIISLFCVYVLCVAVLKHKKYYLFLSSFWFFNSISQITIAITSFYNYQSSELTTIFQAVELWSIPLLFLHFVNAYIIRTHKFIQRKPCLRHDCPSRIFL